jgi:integrative and conjugative element protein (TIGR02256 family)
VAVDRIWIPERARVNLIWEAQSWDPKETGGLLLGHIGVEGDVVIREVSTPGLAAERSEWSYLPDQAHDEKIVADCYRASGGRMTYVGDWHSHPGGKAYLSKDDRAVLRRVANWPAAQLSNPAMMVVGLGATFQIAAWRWQGHGRFRWSGDRVTPLQIRLYSE